MSALLNLQHDYNISSSEEEILNNEENDKLCSKKQNEDLAKLPLPKIFSNAMADTGDSTKIHQGRKRTFAHERGNWATHIFLPYPSTLQEDMQKFVSATVLKLKKRRGK